MKIVYSSFDGRYSDNPRALYEHYSRGGGDEHIWLSHPAHRRGFAPGLTTVTMAAECHEAATIGLTRRLRGN